jgi:hypothetical protein
MIRNKLLGLMLLVVLLVGLSVMGTRILLPESQDTENCLSDTFDKTRIIEEAASAKESLDSYWWLNSGAYLYIQDGIAHSILGQLPEKDKWRYRYLKSKPETTMDGYRPQNILRLITRKKWRNVSQEVYFQMTDYDLSPHENRNQSNALLLFSRYIDSDNLYYAGLRVDGAAVIKKKLVGTYYTLGMVPVIDGKYDRDTNPIMLPYNQWIGEKFVVRTLADNTVLLELYLDFEGSGEWNRVLSIIDADGVQGPLALRNAAYGGIRTDFMDVFIKKYIICELKNASDIN